LAEGRTDKSRLLPVTILITEFDHKPDMDPAWEARLALMSFHVRPTV
jgi:hypothetical protein